MDEINDECMAAANDEIEEIDVEEEIPTIQLVAETP
jgi:hypothetical protein